MKLNELLNTPRFITGCDRFQKPLADFIIKNDLNLIAETGSGVSTIFILKSMQERGSGFLYSIDPEPFCEYEIQHPQYELIKKKSLDAIADLYLKAGALDLALVDGDHDVAAQYYDYAMFYDCLRLGGWLVADDFWWNNQTVWDDFCKKHDLKQIEIGGIRAAAGNELTFYKIYPSTRER